MRSLHEIVPNPHGRCQGVLAREHSKAVVT